MKFNLPEFDNKKVIFIGKGIETKSCEVFLKKNTTVRSFEYIDEAINGINYLERLKNIDTDTMVIKSPGCPGDIVPVDYTTATILFFKCLAQLNAYSIGVTGTKGKTTTSSLLAHVLMNYGKKVVLCGNMGKPMLDTLGQATKDTIFVVELSSYQLAELTSSPNTAIITNLYNDHVDYHGSLEKYWEAKHNIMRYMKKDGVVIYSSQAKAVKKWLAKSYAKGIECDKDDQKIHLENAKLFGRHNAENALLVFKCASLFGMSKDEFYMALNSFQPIKHRLQIVKKINGITYIDDAIASQPEATIAGIRACREKIGIIGCMMLGGQNREYDFKQLITVLVDESIPCLVLFPETGTLIKNQLPHDTYKPKIFETTNMASAVKWANENCPEDTVCLLSTASPSYSLWKNFEEKGQLFQEAVLSL